jgi:NADH-quinone oxidoreductase subunit L
MDLNLLLTDKNWLPWLIPVGPLLAFFIITLVTNRSRLMPATSHDYSGDGQHPAYPGLGVQVVTPGGRVASIIVGMSGIVMAWLISLAVVGNAFGIEDFGKKVMESAVTWMSTGTTMFEMGVLVDPLTTIMLIMVPLACMMIFIYAIGYAAHDPRQARFFALISLFAGAMLTLVVADNLLLLFVGWEVMGLCSYLLIGFWYEKPSAYKAAQKAFMTTRVADVIMLLGIVYLYASTGTLNFRDILYNEEVLTALANTPAILFGGISAASVIGVFLVIGTIGKSAQFPMHVWLPDAMEGPTPVSAMIHAAAMVSAGIYAIIRMYPLLEAGAAPHSGEFNAPLMLMAVVGSVTALFAATIAVAQNDVKKVLAYSTISQLGFMVAALGIGAYVAATFHLITHAFFKALLFMASGAVIHGMEHGHHHVEHAHGHGHDDHAHDEHDDHDQLVYDHDEHGHPIAVAADQGHGHAPAPAKQMVVASQMPGAFDPQDMMNMGGLSKTMPVTWITFLIGGLSLAGFPLITAGFWSKDEILLDAWVGLSEGFGPHALVFICLALAAFMTAFYTARQLSLTFLGEPRTPAAKHANLGMGAVSATMTLPLIILSVFALLAGFVGVHPDFPLLSAIFSPNREIPFKEFLGYTLLEKPELVPFSIVAPLASFAVALGGLGLGFWMYARKPLKAGQPDPMVAILGPIYPVLKNKYYFDELYTNVIVKPLQWFSREVAYVFLDKGVIDGFLHLTGRVFTWLGDIIKMLNMWLIDGVGDGVPELIQRFGGYFRRIQSGSVQQYMLIIALAALVIGIIFALSSGVLQASP